MGRLAFAIPLASALAAIGGAGAGVRLARSVDAGLPVETPQVVACRDATTLCQR